MQLLGNHANLGIADGESGVVAGKAPSGREHGRRLLDTVQGGLESFSNLPHADKGDKRFQNFVGAFSDRVNARVPHHAFERFVVEVALAPVNLERFINALPEHLGGIDLEDRGFEHVIVGAPVDERGGLDG